MSVSVAYSQVAICVVAVVLAFCVQSVYRSKVQNNHQQAPLVPGLPLLGNTISLATHGAGFIHQCRRLVCRRNLQAYLTLHCSLKVDQFCAAWGYFQTHASRAVHDLFVGSCKHQVILHRP